MSRAADLAALVVDVNTTEAKTDELTGKTSAGSIAVTGEGGSTTTNLQQGLAKCWVNFDGSGTVEILDSTNTASITDVATGNYSANYTNAMGNTFAAKFYSCDGNNSTNYARIGTMAGAASASLAQVRTHLASNTTLADMDRVNITVNGDLA